jgi:hypothetical protein
VPTLLEAIQQIGWVQALDKSGMGYGFFTVMHYFTLFALTGTAFAFDMRLLGLVAKDQPVRKFADELFPWIWTFMFFAIVSGFMLALVAAEDYYFAPTMRWKVFITLLAFLCTLFIRRSVPKWDAAPQLPGTAKLMAIVSVLLWLGAILGGNGIAAYCGLG